MVRTKRARLSTGIYQDRYGVSIIVRGKEHRHPVDTPLGELQRTRRELLGTSPGRARPGTFAADVTAYLHTLPDGQRRRDARNLLRHWLEAGFGPRSRHSLSAVEIQQQLQAWAGRFSPATCKALRSRLSTFYRTMNGAAGANPVRDVPHITVRYEEPRAIPYPLIDAILAQMRPSLSRLRLTIMAYSGLTQAMLRRVQARDLDLVAGTVYVRPRRKGAGTEGRTQPLSPQAVAAFRALVAAEGLGGFSGRGLAQTWTVALRKTRRAWPVDQPWPLADDARPYDLRHSYASHVLASTGNLHAVASLLMHSSIQTTRRYTQGAVSDEARAAVLNSFGSSMPSSKTADKPAQKAPPMTRKRRVHRKAKSGRK